MADYFSFCRFIHALQLNNHSQVKASQDLKFAQLTTIASTTSYSRSITTAQQPVLIKQSYGAYFLSSTDD